jgi:hypothetical protein
VTTKWSKLPISAKKALTESSSKKLTVLASISPEIREKY